MGRKWVYSHWCEGKFRRDRIFSKDCQKIIEMSEPEKGQAKCLPGKCSTHKRKFEKQSYKFLTDIKWQTRNEKIKCAHILGWSHY